MSLIVASIAAAAAGLTAGAFAFRSWRRRRRTAAATSQVLQLAVASPSAPPNPLEPLPVGLGDVVQVAGESRWPRSAVAAKHDGKVRCALLLSREGSREQLVVSFRPPARHLYWLERVSAELPSSPPSRLELASGLLDRQATFPAELESLGEAMLELGPHGDVSLYEGAVGNAALILSSAQAVHVWHGIRVDQGDYELLGQVTPGDEVGAS